MRSCEPSRNQVLWRPRRKGIYLGQRGTFAIPIYGRAVLRRRRDLLRHLSSDADRMPSAFVSDLRRDKTLPGAESGDSANRRVGGLPRLNEVGSVSARPYALGGAP